jgi:hypothetical protein
MDFYKSVLDNLGDLRDYGDYNQLGDLINYKCIR